MALWQMTNTEIQMMGPLPNDMEAVFGQVALGLLEKNDTKSLEKLMKLRARARDIMKELDGLSKSSKS